MLRAQCRVAVPDAPAVMLQLLEHYAEHGEVTHSDGRGRIDTVFGHAELDCSGDSIAARVGADDETSLAYMKLGVVYHLREFTPDRELDIRWTGHGEIGVPPPYFREMTVVSSSDLTPSMRRVVLRGPQLDRFARDGIHVRLLFPPKGRSPVWPVLGEDGCPHWPEGEDALVARVYTVRSLDLSRSEMTIDILRHDGDATPGSHFAVGAQAGDIVGVVGPAGEGVPTARSLHLFGDETAIPAIARILDVLPSDATAHATIEIASPAERQSLPGGENIAVDWIIRGEDTLAARARWLQPSAVSPETYVWAGCEFADFKAIRRHCRAVLGLKRDRHLVVAYWRKGQSEDERKHED